MSLSDSLASQSQTVYCPLIHTERVVNQLHQHYRQRLLHYTAAEAPKRHLFRVRACFRLCCPVSYRQSLAALSQSEQNQSEQVELNALRSCAIHFISVAVTACKHHSNMPRTKVGQDPLQHKVFQTLSVLPVDMPDNT